MLSWINQKSSLVPDCNCDHVLQKPPCIDRCITSLLVPSWKSNWPEAGPSFQWELSLTDIPGGRAVYLARNLCGLLVGMGSVWSSKRLGIRSDQRHLKMTTHANEDSPEPGLFSWRLNFLPPFWLILSWEGLHKTYGREEMIKCRRIGGCGKNLIEVTIQGFTFK